VHTVTLRWCLGSLQAAIGHTEQAAYELHRAQVDNQELLGPDHPDTLAIREELRQLTALADPAIPAPRPATEPSSPNARPTSGSDLAADQPATRTAAGPGSIGGTSATDSSASTASG
jgi:hypothetical protein